MFLDDLEEDEELQEQYKKNRKLDAKLEYYESWFMTIAFCTAIVWGLVQ